jgi:hypothetical protein
MKFHKALLSHFRIKYLRTQRTMKDDRLMSFAAQYSSTSSSSHVGMAMLVVSVLFGNDIVSVLSFALAPSGWALGAGWKGGEASMPPGYVMTGTG